MRFEASPARLRVIPDIHGEPAALEQALAGLDVEPVAGADATHLVFLGDLVDNGPDSPAVLRRVLALLEQGRATLLRSNHDDKLFRALIGRKVRIGPQLNRTLTDLRAQPDAGSLIRRFVQAYQQAPYWLEWSPPQPFSAVAPASAHAPENPPPLYLFAHGAVHPQMRVNPSSLTTRERDKLCWLALYGDGTPGPGVDDLPVRTYAWIDKLPAGMTAVVGHDVRSREQPLQVAGSLGGKALFMDNGCGKHRVHGGCLSWLDLPGEVVWQAQLPD